MNRIRQHAIHMITDVVNEALDGDGLPIAHMTSEEQHAIKTEIEDMLMELMDTLPMPRPLGSVIPPYKTITWDDLTLEQRQMLLGCHLATVTVSRRQEGWQTAWDLEGLKLVEMLSGSARHNAGGGAVEVALTDAGREIVKGKDMRDWFGDKNRKT